jgi:hypothetical protein
MRVLFMSRRLLSILIIAFLLLPAAGYVAYASQTDRLTLYLYVLDVDNKGVEAQFYVYMIHPEGPSTLVALGKTDIRGRAYIGLSIGTLIKEWKGLGVKPFLQVDVLGYGANSSDLRTVTLLYDPDTLKGPATTPLIARLGIRASSFSSNPSPMIDYPESTPLAVGAQYLQPILKHYDENWRWIRLAQAVTDQRSAAKVYTQIEVSKTFQSGLLVADSISNQFQALYGTSITTASGGSVTAIASRSGAVCASMKARLVWEEWWVPDLVYGYRYQERFYYKDVDPSSLTTTPYSIYAPELTYNLEATASGRGHVDDLSAYYIAWEHIYTSSVTTTFFGVALPLDLSNVISGLTDVPTFITQLLPRVTYIADKQSTSVNSAVDVTVWADSGCTAHIYRARYPDAGVETVYINITT